MVISVCMILRGFTTYILSHFLFSHLLLHSVRGTLKLPALFLFFSFCTVTPLAYPSLSFFFTSTLSMYFKPPSYKSLLTKFTIISDIANNSFTPFTCTLKLLSLWFHYMNCKLPRELKISFQCLNDSEDNGELQMGQHRDELYKLMLNHMPMLQLFCWSTEHTIYLMYITWNI